MITRFCGSLDIWVVYHPRCPEGGDGSSPCYGLQVIRNDAIIWTDYIAVRRSPLRMFGAKRRAHITEHVRKTILRMVKRRKSVKEPTYENELEFLPNGKLRIRRQLQQHRYVKNGSKTRPPHDPKLFRRIMKLALKHERLVDKEKFEEADAIRDVLRDALLQYYGPMFEKHLNESNLASTSTPIVIFDLPDAFRFVKEGYRAKDPFYRLDIAALHWAKRTTFYGGVGSILVFVNETLLATLKHI